MEEKDGRVIPKILVLILVIIVLGSGIYGSYAFISYRADLQGDSTGVVSTCSLKMSALYDDEINLTNAYPVDDEIGILSVPGTFSISLNDTTCTEANYTIKMISCNDEESIDPDLIRYQLVNTVTGEEVVDSNPLMMNVAGSVFDIANYSYRMWISSEATNNDLYVTDENGDYVLDDNNSYITKSFCVKANVLVLAK